MLIIQEYKTLTNKKFLSKFENEKWYSEEDVDRIIENCINAKINVEKFRITGIVQCPICGKKFIKKNDYNYKPNCGCFKKNLMVSIG